MPAVMHLWRGKAGVPHHRFARTDYIAPGEDFNETPKLYCRLELDIHVELAWACWAFVCAGECGEEADDG
jgi:hypothetical protein